MIRKNLFFSFTAVLFLISCTSAEQKFINKMARQLQIYYKVTDNQAGFHGINGADLGAQNAEVFTASIFLHNSGEEITDKNWSIYFNSSRRILRTNNDQFSVKHITGGLYVLRPTENFKGIPSGKQLEISVTGEFSQLLASDIFPRWYITAEGAKPQIIRNTDTEDPQNFVYPLEEEGLLRSSPHDKNVLMAPEARFQKNAALRLLDKQTLRDRIIPTPLSSEIFPENIDLSSGVCFENSSLEEEALSSVKKRLQILGIKTNTDGSGHHIKIQMIPEIFDSGMQISGAYQMRIAPESTEIFGYDGAGMFYGLQSFLALIDIEEKTIPAAGLYDAPQFPHRAMHLDIARNFHSKESIYRLLDQMAAYKLNRFHLHLSDNEGWRLEIPDLPELTDISARRGFDLSEEKMLLSQLGSGPSSDNSGSGYLSRRDYIDILKYAKARYILVIPEITMPAHARAAVTAMEARYHNLIKKGKKEQAEQYRLLDPEDTSSATTAEYYDRRSFINPALQSSLNFVEKVISEIVKMHQEAEHPLTIWHYGGDRPENIFLGHGFQNADAPIKSPNLGIVSQKQEDHPFAKSPAVQKLIEQGAVSSITRLNAYFAVQVSRILAKYGIIKMAARQEAFKDLHNADQLSVSEAEADITVDIPNISKSVSDLSDKNFSIILCNPDFLNFDAPYEVHPKERGAYQKARFIDERKIFSFAPNNSAQNAETSVDLNGQYYSAVDAPWNEIHGIQGQLWSEFIYTDAQMEYMIYPRLLILAERAWHKASWEQNYTPGRVYNGSRTHYVNQKQLQKEWEIFANILGQKELPKLDKYHIQYRIDVPGARIRDGIFEMNTALPGLRLEYSTDKGQTWQEYTQPIPVSADVSFRAVAANGRSGRIETLER